MMHRADTITGTTMLILVAVMTMSGLIHAEIPQIISYQGKVTDAGGTPVPDGTYSMQFRIYDSATGWTLLWYSGNYPVQVTDGVFTILLGESPHPEIDLPFDQDYWLMLTLEGTDQMPRTRLVSSGYAYMASGLVAGTEVSGSVTEGSNPAAIGAFNTATSGSNYGVYARTYSTSGRAIYGHATASTGYTYGVYGYSSATSGRGVYGYAGSTIGTTYGVYGGSFSSSGTGVLGESKLYGVRGEATSSSGGRGVYGLATATNGTTWGVVGQSSSTSGVGVLGANYSVSGATYGLYGYTQSGSGHAVHGWSLSSAGYAGYFEGRVHVAGNLSKSGGSFKIDHPLDPEGKYLYHSFVESPDMMNIYNGNITLDANGEAWVDLPDWFAALNQEFRYQLTCIGGFAPVYVAQEIAKNRFQIAGGEQGMQISWQVTGVRHDPYAEAHRIPVEETKPPGELGTYLHPLEYGHTETMGLEYQRDKDLKLSLTVPKPERPEVPRMEKEE